VPPFEETTQKRAAMFRRVPDVRERKCGACLITIRAASRCQGVFSYRGAFACWHSFTASWLASRPSRGWVKPV